MKYLFVFLFCSHLFAGACFCQVNDIGINLKERGYIESIGQGEKEVKFNYIKDSRIQALRLKTGDAEMVADGKKQGRNSSLLKAGMQVLVEGDYFQESNYGVAKTITILEADKKKSFEGRIDAIAGDYAIVDGRKIKMAKGSKINGVQDYKGKSFASVQNLKLGDYAKAEGSNADGFYSVTKLEVWPNIETAGDKKAKAAQGLIHNAYYPVWSDETQRPQLFGSYLPGIGRITDSKTIQDYVNRIGMSLIPEYAKAKIHFMFVVIDKNEFNAFVYPNGFACVYTGLLNQIQNEAQLAAVLGHEIAHALYEHTAAGTSLREKKKQGSFSRILAKNIIGNTVAIIDNHTANSSADHFAKDILSKADTGTMQLLLSDLPDVLALRSVSKYSISQEAQADRIGLYLMQQAGYDPREAAIVWKDNYNNTPARLSETNQAGSEVNAMLQEAASDSSSLSAIAKRLAKGKLYGLMNKTVKNSTKDHPDDIVRFEALNQLVSQYWSADDLLRIVKKGDDSWQQTFTAAQPELEKDEWAWGYENLEDTAYGTRMNYLNFAIKKGYRPIENYYFLRGVLYMQLSKWKEAADDYSKVIMINPKDTAALYRRGLVRYISGKPADAITDFTKAISINPDNETYYYQRGYSYYHLNKFKEAAAGFSEAISLNTNVAKYYFARGNSSYKLLKYAAALADYQRTAEIEPDNEAVVNNIAVCKAAMANKKSGTIQLVIVQ